MKTKKSRKTTHLRHPLFANFPLAQRIEYEKIQAKFASMETSANNSPPALSLQQSLDQANPQVTQTQEKEHSSSSTPETQSINSSPDKMNLDAINRKRTQAPPTTPPQPRKKLTLTHT